MGDCERRDTKQIQQMSACTSPTPSSAKMPNAPRKDKAMKRAREADAILDIRIKVRMDGIDERFKEATKEIEEEFDEDFGHRRFKQAVQGNFAKEDEGRWRKVEGTFETFKDYVDWTAHGEHDMERVTDGMESMIDLIKKQRSLLQKQKELIHAMVEAQCVVEESVKRMRAV